jgi:hypothetical protein
MKWRAFEGVSFLMLHRAIRACCNAQADHQQQPECVSLEIPLVISQTQYVHRYFNAVDSFEQQLAQLACCPAQTTLHNYLAAGLPTQGERISSLRNH